MTTAVEEALRVLRAALANCDSGLRTGSFAPSVIREQIQVVITLLEEDQCAS